MLFKNWMIIALQYCIGFCCSVQFSCSVVSLCDPMDCKHTRPPCPSPTPRVHSNSCPLSLWCCPTISSSAFPFSSCLQPFPASGSFWISQLFASGGQRIGVSASTSSEYSGLISFRMDWLDLLAVQGTLKSLLQLYNNMNQLYMCPSLMSLPPSLMSLPPSHPLPPV